MAMTLMMMMMVLMVMMMIFYDVDNDDDDDDDDVENAGRLVGRRPGDVASCFASAEKVKFLKSQIFCIFIYFGICICICTYSCI